MRRILARRVLALILLLLLSVLTVPCSASPSGIAFTHVTVIDCTGAPAKQDMTVLVRGDRIAAIGKDVQLPEGTRIIDAAGKYMIPGLWDMHVHTSSRYFRDCFPLFLACGVTGVRDMGNSSEEDVFFIRKETREGRILGPQVISPGPIVDGPHPAWPGSLSVKTPAEARQAVKGLKERGADFIKVYSLLPRDLFLEIASEARAQSIPFAGHVPVAIGAAEASDAGMKSIEHMTGMISSCSSMEEEFRREFLKVVEQNPGDRPAQIRLSRALGRKVLEGYDERKADDLFRRLARNGTWEVPTLTVIRSAGMIAGYDFRKDERLKYMPGFVRREWNPDADFRLRGRTPEDLADAAASFKKLLEMIGKMNRAGVGILAGTDTPTWTFPGFSLHDELELLVQAGLTPMEAIQTATRNPARFLGLTDSLGTIERGKMADLVLLDADPLESIANVRKIGTVVYRGRLFDRAEIGKMLDGVEAAMK